MTTNNNTCPSQSDFKGYLNGTLPESGIKTFENHLQTCPLCLEAIDGYKMVFKQGYVNPVLKQEVSKPKYHLSRRLIPYAAAVTLLAGLFLSQVLNWWPAKTQMVADNTIVNTDIKKTLSHKSDVDYWYIGSEDNIVYNDQIVSADELTEISKIETEVTQVVIQLEEPNLQITDDIVSAIKSNQSVPVYTYSKRRGLKKN